MSNVLVELKYSKEYEWLCKEVDGIYIVGIIEYVQELFGDMVFVDLLEVGVIVEVGVDCVVVEFVKVVFDIYVLISGEIVVVNEELNDFLELVNSDLYIDGWIFKIKVSDEVQVVVLLDVVVYEVLLEDE